jgi:hypothetical protein
LGFGKKGVGKRVREKVRVLELGHKGPARRRRRIE